MRNLNLLLVLFALVILSFNACKPQQKSFNVINLNDAYGIRKYSTLYSLPKTVVRVNLEVVKTTYKKGPYHSYAESNLGLSDVVSKNKEFWKITGVKFETYAIVDTNHNYLIETNDENNRIELQLTDFGLLKSVYPEYSNYSLKNEPEEELKSISSFKSGNLKSHKLTDLVELDFDDVPLPKAVISKRSIREQAAELSKTILTLREDRAAILVGDGYTESMPDGGALEMMVGKIDLIQQQYLSMFIGKVKKESFQYSFDYIPEEPRKITQSILFRFSEENGIVENNDMSGIPMIIEIESYENLKNYEDFKKKQSYLKRAAKKKEESNGLYYRIPEMGIVRLLANEDVLIQEKIKLSQLGSIHSLPSKYLDGNYVISLYPELGSIKSIKKASKVSSGKAK